MWQGICGRFFITPVNFPNQIAVEAHEFFPNSQNTWRIHDQQVRSWERLVAEFDISEFDARQFERRLRNGEPIDFEAFISADGEALHEED